MVFFFGEPSTDVLFTGIDGQSLDGKLVFDQDDILEVISIDTDLWQVRNAFGTIGGMSYAHQSTYMLTILNVTTDVRPLYLKPQILFRAARNCTCE
jgi:hypothetical protein